LLFRLSHVFSKELLWKGQDMVNHIVLMKFKNGISEPDIKDLEISMDDLPNKITEIHTYEFGRNLVSSQKSYDFALVALFANLQTLQQYQSHPQYLKVAEKIRKICDDIISVNFEGSDAGSTAIERPPWDPIPLK
jgi:hypothetical protein